MTRAHPTPCWGRIVSFTADQPQKLSHGVDNAHPQLIAHSDTSITYRFECPLDERRIHRIEETRDGGDLRLRCVVRFTVLQHQRAGQLPGGYLVTDVVSASETFHVEVAQSHWIKRVLPGLDYDRIRLVGIPNLELVGGDFAGSVEALTRAQDCFHRGDYDYAAAQCRFAIDPIRADLKLHMQDGRSSALLDLLVDESESEFLSRIGTATGKWLNHLTTGAYGRSSHAHHTVGQFSRHAAAELILVTTAMVSLVGRLTFANPSPPAPDDRPDDGPERTPQ